MSRIASSDMLASLETTVSDYLVIGCIDIDTGEAPAFTVDDASISVDELPAGLRAGAALLAIDSNVDTTDLLPLLARLRDVHADHVVVFVDNDAASDLKNALVAMGFEARKSPSEDGLVFAWDPVLANRPREWNNSRNWANPENFSRYRW